MRPAGVVRVRWTPGALVRWDNQTTVHRSVDDFGDAPRVLHRVSTTGQAPAGVSLLDAKLSRIEQ